MVFVDLGFASGGDRCAAGPDRRATRAVVSTIVVNEGRECAVDLEIAAGPGQQGAAESVAGAQHPRSHRGAARGVVRARGSGRWSGATPPIGAATSTIWRRCAGPAVAAVRADYDKVLRQRTALLKSAFGCAVPRRPGCTGHARRVGRPPCRARRRVDGGPDDSGRTSWRRRWQKAYQLLAPASRPAVDRLPRQRGRRVRPDARRDVCWRPPCWRPGAAPRRRTRTRRVSGRSAPRRSGVAARRPTGQRLCQPWGIVVDGGGVAVGGL